MWRHRDSGAEINNLIRTVLEGFRNPEDGTTRSAEAIASAGARIQGDFQQALERIQPEDLQVCIPINVLEVPENERGLYGRVEQGRFNPTLEEFLEAQIQATRYFCRVELNDNIPRTAMDAAKFAVAGRGKRNDYARAVDQLTGFMRLDILSRGGGERVDYTMIPGARPDYPESSSDRAGVFSVGDIMPGGISELPTRIVGDRRERVQSAQWYKGAGIVLVQENDGRCVIHSNQSFGQMYGEYGQDGMTPVLPASLAALENSLRAGGIPMERAVGYDELHLVFPQGVGFHEARQRIERALAGISQGAASVRVDNSPITPLTLKVNPVDGTVRIEIDLQRMDTAQVEAARSVFAGISQAHNVIHAVTVPAADRMHLILPRDRVGELTNILGTLGEALQANHLPPIKMSVRNPGDAQIGGALFDALDAVSGRLFPGRGADPGPYRGR